MLRDRRIWFLIFPGIILLVGVLLLLYYRNTYQTLWVHNPYAHPVRLENAGKDSRTLEPWAFERISLPEGKYQFKVFSATGEKVLDQAEVVIPPPTPSAILYSIGAAGCYRVTHQDTATGKSSSTITTHQQILYPGNLEDPPLIPGDKLEDAHLEQTARHSVTLESIPTQLLVIAEEACQKSDWANALQTARLAQQVFLPLPDDVFFATACTLESRALLGLKRHDDALQVIEKLLKTPEVGVESICLAQNCLFGLLPAKRIEDLFSERQKLSPSPANGLLLARIVDDSSQAQTLLLEAMASKELSLLGGQTLVQRMLWEGRIKEVRDLLSRFNTGQDNPPTDFERISEIWVKETSAEDLWHMATQLPAQLSDPLDSIPWLVGSAAMLGDATQALQMLKEVQWPRSEKILPSDLFWTCEVLLAQGKYQEARKIYDSAVEKSSPWDAVANLDTALAELPPDEALRVFENQFRKPISILEPYRLAWYRLARESGLDEIARQVLFPYALAEVGTKRRVVWEILEGGDWQPEKLLLFAVSHTPQETNDVLYASALRGQLDGDLVRAKAFFQHCRRYPPVLDFPAGAARRDLDLYQNR